MRLIILILLLGVSVIAHAQGMPAGMQEAMECMNTLDQDALKEFGENGQKMGEEIKALCDKGDESGARDLAMSYIKEMDGNEEIKKLRDCSEIMRKAMPSMPIPEIPNADQYINETESVCENID